MICKDRPFSRSEFDRRIPLPIGGIATYMATAEYTVLAKLEWASRTGSDRQFRDVVDLLRVRATDLDDADLNRWASELNVRESLDRARRTAQGDLPADPTR